MSLTATPPTTTNINGSSALTDTELITLIKQDAWMEGCDISRRQAGYVLELLERATHDIRSSPKDIYILTKVDMILAHEVLDAIMPDGVIQPAEGSAHEALNHKFLSGPGVSFTHTFVENYTTGERDCAMVITVIKTTAA